MGNLSVREEKRGFKNTPGGGLLGWAPTGQNTSPFFCSLGY